MEKKIAYGTTDLLPNVPFDDKDVKVRISIFVDGDILLAYRRRAEQIGAKYQTLMNLKLRESLVDLEGDERKQRLDPELKKEIRAFIKEELKKAS